MFAIVTFPWPVASANVQLAGPGRQARQALATTRTTAQARGLNRASQDELASDPEPRRAILSARQA